MRQLLFSVYNLFASHAYSFFFFFSYRTIRCSAYNHFCKYYTYSLDLHNEKLQIATSHKADCITTDSLLTLSCPLNILKVEVSLSGLLENIIATACYCWFIWRCSMYLLECNCGSCIHYLLLRQLALCLRYTSYILHHKKRQFF